jgi:hypothetical protein
MPTRVTLDEHRIARVNGRPFFPIMARHVPVFRGEQLKNPWSATAEEYARLRDIGFNAVRFVPFGGQAFTFDDHRVPGDFGGLLFYAYVYNRAELSKDADPRKRDLAALVNAVRERDDFLGYEQFNEPAYTWLNQGLAQASPEGMAAGSAEIRRLDPHHPIRVGHMCSNLVATLRKYNPAADVVGCNPYVVRSPDMRRFVGSRPDGYMTDHADRTISAVGRYTDKMMRVADGRAVWMQIQGSANENWYLPEHTPETRDHGVYEHHRLYPTYWQMRFMAFHAIVRGATGLEWMLVRHPVESPSFHDVRRVIGELSELHDALASATLAHEFEITYRELGFSDWEGVQTMVKMHDGGPWIIAVNTQFDPMEATFSNLPRGLGSRLDVVGETDDPRAGIPAGVKLGQRERSVRIEGGAFTDFFRPYEAHVYRPAG